MNNVLVACFSASGVTKSVGEKLAEAANADFYEIKPEVPYTRADLDWMNKKSRSTLEMEDKNSRPALADKDADVEKYYIIFLGFPIWLAYHKLIQCTQARSWVQFLTIAISEYTM